MDILIDVGGRVNLQYGNIALRMLILFDSIISHLEMYPKEIPINGFKGLCTGLFTTAGFMREN